MENIGNIQELRKLPENNIIPPSGPNPEVHAQHGSSIKTCLKSRFWSSKKFHPPMKPHPLLITTMMPSAVEKLALLAAVWQECGCKEQEECQWELQEEEELHAEMEREEAEKVVEEAWKQEEEQMIADEAQIAAEEAQKKEEAAKAAALHKEAQKANK